MIRPLGRDWDRAIGILVAQMTEMSFQSEGTELKTELGISLKEKTDYVNLEMAY